MNLSNFSDDLPGQGFAFGKGVWRLWWFAHAALLLPVIWFADVFSRYVPGEPMPGGQTVFALILLHMFVFAVFTLVNTLLIVFCTNEPVVPRMILWPLLLVLCWILPCALALFGMEMGTTEDAEPGDGWTGAACVGVALLVWYWANIAALRRIRRG